MRVRLCRPPRRFTFELVSYVRLRSEFLLNRASFACGFAWPAQGGPLPVAQRRILAQQAQLLFVVYLVIDMERATISPEDVVMDVDGGDGDDDSAFPAMKPQSESAASIRFQPVKAVDANVRARLGWRRRAVCLGRS